MNIHLWQIASGLGVGAFVAFLFYLVIKQFGQRSGRGFQTSRLGTEATAIIAVLIVLTFGGITVVALVLYAPQRKAPEPILSPMDPDPLSHQSSLDELKESIAAQQGSGILELQAKNLDKASEYLKEADDNLDKAEKQAPDDLTVIELRGYMWKDWAQLSEDLGKPEEVKKYLGNAKATFDRVLERRPTPSAYNGLGSVYWMQGDLKSAEREIRNALKLAPDYPEAIRDLNQLLRSQGR